jgi:hypothetical protein
MGAVNFRGVHPLFGRGNKELPPSYQQRSPYYWWWAFLRRNPEYLRTCANDGGGELATLYTDFGDVREDDFKSWWTANQRGATLFGEKPLPLSLRELSTAAEWDASWRASDVMVVAVPLAVSKRRLQTYFTALLKKRHEGKRGRKALSEPNVSTAKYPLHRNVSVNTLRIQLAVYDAVTANKLQEKPRPLWQLGVSLKLVPGAMPLARDLPADAALKRAVLSSTVSRYYRAAERLVANTAKGEFPNSK